MLRRVLRSQMFANAGARLKPHQKPEFDLDFIRFPYGHSPVRVTGEWVVEHGGYNYSSDSLDYEDHSMTMLHQRPVSWRSYWVVVWGVASIALLYYVGLEMPFVGITFGQPYMDHTMNAIKALNDDEEIHDWEALKKQWLEMKRKAEAEE